MRKTVWVMIVLAMVMCGSAVAQDEKPWTKAGTEAGQESVGPDGGTMVWVPAGSFRMGTTAEDAAVAERRSKIWQPGLALRSASGFGPVLWPIGIVKRSGQGVPQV